MRRRPAFNRKNLLVAAIFLVFVIAATLVFAEDGEAGSAMYGTFWALVPPIVAIALALITKEVYMSLFTGILVGAFFVANGNPVGAMHVAFDNGIIEVLTDSWNVGILTFTIFLGIVGALVFKSGGSAAYGRWAEKAIKTRTGAQLATVALGVLIFVDDYFNCLTVGSVMRPVTDKHGISRAKLAYIIDATAAPVCMISPISSWAAAVTGIIPEMDEIGRFTMFTNSIPFNLYAILTIIMMITISLLKVDFGPMKKHEDNAAKGDLYTTPDRPYENAVEEVPNPKGKIIDLAIPIFALLVPGCIFGLAYTGGFFEGASFMDSLADCDASMGLVYGTFVAMVLVFIYYMLRRVLTFKEFTDCIPLGFRDMVPAVLILIFAWALSNITKSYLGAPEYVAGIVASSAAGLQKMLPAIIYLIGVGLSFATGTSWGTFGILLPIVIAVFPYGNPLLFPAVGACLAGAITGDHCSPISDTTIMASAGAQSNHINHVATQLPYAMFVTAICFVFYVIMGFWPSPIVTVLAVIAMVGSLFIIKKVQANKLTNKVSA